MTTILHSVPSLSCAAGGLSVAVAEMCSALAEQGGEIALVCERGDKQDEVPLGAKVKVSRMEGSNLSEAVGARDDIALIHQHGIWTSHSRSMSKAAQGRGIPYVVSPHGMLEPWALAHHGWKKRFAMWLYQKRNLDAAEALHATSEMEARNLRELGLRQPIIILPNGIQSPSSSLTGIPAPTRKQALFLSRIHPKKGLPMLLEAWAMVRPDGWELVIAGPDEVGQEAELKAQAERLGIAAQVQFPGPLFGEAKEQAFRQASLFVLPTYSENFGVVVGEALQCGLPVITTTGTPWQLLEERNCGWWVEPTTDAIAEALGKAIGQSEAERPAMGERGKALVEERFRWPGIAKDMLAVYAWLLGGGDQPDIPIL